MKYSSVLALFLFASSTTAQAPWSGDMHPSIGFPQNCNISEGGSCAPTYADLKTGNALWPCPVGNATNTTCGASGCEVGVGEGNPLCMNLDAANPCCCSKPGCNSEPLFNWIVGVCKGPSCACGNSHANSCAPQNRSDQCGSECTGPTVRCCFGADVTPLVPFYDEGTHAKVNYIASFQFNPETSLWDMQPESSFNTDGRYPTFDMMQPNGGLPASQAWLAPQPGGSAFWSLGYYPAGVRGVGPPGALFIMSTEDWFGGTWYMLNALAMDRGPANGYPSDSCAITNDNCWASGNSGEMDFLEPGWNNPKTAAMNYTQTFSTQNNQVGRCFVGGVNSGGFGSKNFILTEPSPLSGAPPEPIIYVAVVDSVGNWVYRIPADQAAEIWPGISRYGVAASIQAAPIRAPDSVNPGTTPYAATFTSNCQAKKYTAALQQECIFNGQQGFCGCGWMELMANTGQPLFPSANCTKDVRGGVTMPWCVDMLGKQN